MGLHVFFGCYHNLFRLMAKCGVLENLLVKEHSHTFCNNDGDVRELDFRFIVNGVKIGAPLHGGWVGGWVGAAAAAAGRGCAGAQGWRAAREGLPAPAGAGARGSLSLQYPSGRVLRACGGQLAVVTGVGNMPAPNPLPPAPNLRPQGLLHHPPAVHRGQGG
jgi:hypothetical protein